MRRVPPPPPPPRQRSRSPLERRQRAVLEAHRRNRASNRGGRAARRRTRAIHRQLLEILLERVLRIIRQLAFAVASERRQWDLRYRQVQERLNYLSREDTFPESKHIVLPNLRSWVAEQPDIREEADRLSIESESVQETVSLPVSRSESETEAEAQTPPPLLVRLTASRASTLAGVSDKEQSIVAATVCFTDSFIGSPIDRFAHTAKGQSSNTATSSGGLDSASTSSGGLDSAATSSVGSDTGETRAT